MEERNYINTLLSKKPIVKLVASTIDCYPKIFSSFNLENIPQTKVC